MSSSLAATGSARDVPAMLYGETDQ
jgi:hypothetical protein